VTRSHAIVMTYFNVFKKKRKKRVVTDIGIRAVSSRDIGKAEDRLVLKSK
jgi:hypothetical protein